MQKWLRFSLSGKFYSREERKRAFWVQKQLMFFALSITPLPHNILTCIQYNISCTIQKSQKTNKTAPRMMQTLSVGKYCAGGACIFDVSPVRQKICKNFALSFVFSLLAQGSRRRLSPARVSGLPATRQNGEFWL